MPDLGQPGCDEEEKDPEEDKGFLLGPGLITGASDDDPSGIGARTAKPGRSSASASAGQSIGEGQKNSRSVFRASRSGPLRFIP
jgi:hypothetical protein